MTDTVFCPKIALWAANIAARVTSIANWAERVEAQLIEAKTQGADLVLLPEHIGAQWLHFAPKGLAPSEEIPWMAAQSDAALAAMRSLPKRHGVALLAGSWATPAGGDPPYVNRAYLLLPDGQLISHDKLCLTPDERDPRAWNMSAGSQIILVNWNGLKLAMIICLDVELPALAVRLAPYEIDLLLVPSMTHRLSGFSRVFSCAKARAVELFTTVCVVGCIGDAGAPLPCMGGAAIFLPCEEALGHTGIAAELAPRNNAEGPGPMLLARDLPIADIRALRRERSEVWPGAWSAEHVTIIESKT